MADTNTLLAGGYKAVFFDLDGTLVDTAPDMVAVLERLMARRGLEPIPEIIARNNVSNGSLGLLRLGFPEASEEELRELVPEFLDDYAGALCVESDVFTPLRDLLAELEDAGILWGVVTNKPERMTFPLLEKLGIGPQAACVVGGDTLTERKPHPAPMLHAANQAGVAPENVVYVGDALRDVEAGRAAGMATVAVGYGYIEDHDDPQSWGADAYVADTMALVSLIRSAVQK